MYVPAGTYLTTTIFLKSNVHLFLHNGAVLQGVTDPKAYKGRAIVVGENIKNTSIQGEGCIDGQGNHKTSSLVMIKVVALMLYCSRIVPMSR